MTPKLSIGPELRYDNNLDSGLGDWTGHFGGFIRYQWGSGEVSLAGGAARQSENGGVDYAPYGTINVLYQY